MTIMTLLVFCIGQISSAPPHLCSVDDITHILQTSTLMHSIHQILSFPQPLVLCSGHWVPFLSPSAVMLDESTEPI